MVFRSHFSTRTLILVIACALLSPGEAHALYAVSSTPQPSIPRPPKSRLQAPEPAQVMPAISQNPAMVSIPVTGFKRTEDDQKNLVFEIAIKDEKAVTLTVPPSMLKAARPGSRKGLLPRSSAVKTAPEAAYFDGDKRFIDVAVSDFPAQNTRLYTITDRNYAMDQQYPGVLPTITFQVIMPAGRASAPNKDPALPCELHVFFHDGLPTAGAESRWQASADPGSCHPWVKTFNPDAFLPPGYWWPFVWTPENPGESVQDFRRDGADRPI